MPGALSFGRVTPPLPGKTIKWRIAQLCPMPSATATVRIDGRGRLTIPQPVREKLGIDGDDVYARVTVHVDENETPDAGAQEADGD